MAKQEDQNERKERGLEDLLDDPIIAELKKQQGGSLNMGKEKGGSQEENTSTKMSVKNTVTGQTGSSAPQGQKGEDVLAGAGEESSPNIPQSVPVKGSISSQDRQTEEEMREATQAAMITSAYELNQQAQLSALTRSRTTESLQAGQAAENADKVEKKEAEATQSYQQKLQQQQMEMEKKRREEYLKKKEEEKEAARKKNLLKEELAEKAKNSLAKKALQEATGFSGSKILRAGFIGIPGVNLSYFALDGLYTMLKWARGK